MAKFRRKPADVRAIRLPARGVDMDPAELDALHDLLEGVDWSSGEDETLEIATLDVVMVAGPGDWIVRDERGECSICTADVFASTYEPVG